MRFSSRVFAQELEIRAKLKDINRAAREANPRSSRGAGSSSRLVPFSIRGVAQRQVANRKLLRQSVSCHNLRGILRAGFDDLDDGEGASAACIYEQCRARWWAVEAIPRAFAKHEPSFFLTLADLRQRVRRGDLATFDPTRLLRRLRRICRELEKEVPDLIAFGVIEISAVIEEDGVVFEPHVHVLLGGATRDQLDRVLPRGKHFNRRVFDVYHLGGLALYVTKFAPEFRSGYAGPNGRQGRTRNPMSVEARAEWLRWYAQRGLPDLMMVHGLGPNFIEEVRTAPTAQLLDRLIGGRGG